MSVKEERDNRLFKVYVQVQRLPQNRAPRLEEEKESFSVGA